MKREILMATAAAAALIIGSGNLHAQQDPNKSGESATGQQGKTGTTESGVAPPSKGAEPRGMVTEGTPRMPENKSGESATGQQGKTGTTESGVNPGGTK